MRKDDYKKHLDKIKCSDEFREKMEGLLSAEPDGTYADCVTTVERADRINIQRWSGLAASAVLVVGIGGVALHTMKNGPDVNTSQDENQNKPEITTDSQNDKTGDYFFNYENNSFYRLAMGVEGNLPDELAGEILEEIKNSLSNQFEIDDETASMDYEIYEAKYSCSNFKYDSVVNQKCNGYVFTISSATDDDFLCKVGDNSLIYMADNGEEKIYNSVDSNELYGEINRIIAENLFNYNWNIVYNEYSEVFHNILNEYRDEIVIKEDAVGISKDAGVFKGLLPFNYHMDESGVLQVYYPLNSLEIAPVSYQVPIGFVSEVSQLMSDGYVDINKTSDTLSYSNMNEKLEYILNHPGFDEFSNFNYCTGQGQFSKGFSIKNFVQEDNMEYLDEDVKGLVKFLAGYEWTEAEYEPLNECLILDYREGEFDLNGLSFSITSDGVIYDSSTNLFYKAENMDIEALQEKFDELIQTNYQVRTAYNLCSRAENYSTFESEVSIFYDPLDETGENQPVNCTGKMYLKNQVPFEGSKDSYSNFYYNLKGIDSDYSGEMYKENRYWSFVEKNGSIAKGFYSGDRDFEGYRLFTRDNYIASGGYDNYDAINIDYDMLYNDALYVFSHTNDEFMEILDNQYVVGQANDISTIEYIQHYENEGEKPEYSEILEFRVDGLGTLIYFRKARRNLETDEVQTYFEFMLNDGVCLGLDGIYVDYDNPDFQFPEMSEELKQELELVYGT